MDIVGIASLPPRSARWPAPHRKTCPPCDVAWTGPHDSRCWVCDGPGTSSPPPTFSSAAVA